MLYDLVIWYGFVSLTHLFLQIHFGHTDYIYSRPKNSSTPQVGVVIPSYNEPVDELVETVEAALKQDYRGDLRVLLVDDGSRDKTAFLEVKERFDGHPRFTAHALEENRGKREAQKYGFDLFCEDCDVIVTIDSDTVLAPNAVKNLVGVFGDPKVGAATANIRVKNQVNLLTKLIDKRYWTAFNYERAAQSLFGGVICCSGPLSAYRAEIIRKVREEYVSQYFLGKKCTFGDDRNLTNLVLREGYRVRYINESLAWTSAPTTMRKWLQQQIRWSKSFYRELIWTFKNIVIPSPRQLHPYILYDMVIQAILPLLLVVALLFAAYRSVFESYLYAFAYLAVLVGVALLRANYAIIRTGEKGFWLFPLYAVLHMFLLIPVRLYAISTLWNNRWGTR